MPARASTFDSLETVLNDDVMCRNSFDLNDDVDARKGIDIQ